MTKKGEKINGLYEKKRKKEKRKRVMDHMNCFSKCDRCAVKTTSERPKVGN